MQEPVYDRKKPDKYAEHLSQVDSQYHVVAQEDIYNQFGLLLISKGTRISRATVGLLERHRLRKILDEQVAIDSQLDNAAFLDDASAYLADNGLLFNDSNYQDYKSAFIRTFTVKILPEVIFQKLTVMKTLLPENYREAIFCSWLAGLLAYELGYTDRRWQNAIVSGLCKDLGLLHIAPEKLDFSDGYSDEKLRALHSHPIIGSIIAHEQKQWDSEISLAIAEHHERIDRSGFPTGKSPDELTLLGQIIAIADIICSLKLTNTSWQKDYRKLVLAFLKVNFGAFHEQVIHGVYSLLSKPGDIVNVDIQPGKLIKRVMEAQHMLESLHQDLTVVYQQFMEEDIAQSESRFNRTALHIDSVINMTGINADDIQTWVREAGDDEQLLIRLAADLQDQDAMHYELFWLFRRLTWGLEDIFRQYGNQPDYLKELYQRIELALDQCQPLYQ